MCSDVSERGRFFLMLRKKAWCWISGVAITYFFCARFLEIPIIFKNRTQGKSKISNRIIQEGIMTPWRFL